jgi:septum formation topological specificity factor MinE
MYLENLIPVKNNKRKIPLIDELFSTPHKSLKKGKKKQSNAMIKYRLQKILLLSLQNLKKEPIPSEYTISLTKDNLDKIRKSRTVGESLKKFMMELKKELNASKTEINISLRLLKGLGYIEIGEYKGYRIFLTMLGNILKKFISKKEYNRLDVLVIPSFAFTTKARLVYGLYYSLGSDFKAWYNALRRDLFEDKLYGMERIASEVLHEIVLSDAGRSPNYYPESILLVNIFSGLNKAHGNKLIDIFRTLNKYVRFEWSNKMPTRFPYKAGAWEALEILDYPNIKQIEEYMGLNLEPLINELKENFEIIENQLIGLYGFPRWY